MRSSFPKHDKHHLRKENGLAMSMPSSWIVFWKRAFHICMYMCVYVYIFMKNSFPKDDSELWDWHCNLVFFIGVYRILEKSCSYTLALT